MVTTKKTQTPMSASNIYLTSQGLVDTRQELSFLKNQKRLEIADRIKSAREVGGMEENSEYNAALDELNSTEVRISELERVLRDAKVINHQLQSDDIVTLGSVVKVEMDGEQDEFTIVGRVEANPSKKRISNESPVGTALLGAKKGDVVEVATPIVRYKCKILEIK